MTILSGFAHSSRGKTLLTLAAAFVVVTAIVLLSLQNAGQSRMTEDGIPLPFATRSSGLQGSLTLLMNRNGIDIYNVTFEGESEDLAPIPGMFLLRVPAGADRIHLDAAFTILEHEGFQTPYPHDVNYFGYRYSSADAAQEIANMNDASFTRRFPGQFFASATARAVDPAHGNFLATFAAEKGIIFRPTAKEVASRVELDANSFYVVVINAEYPDSIQNGPVNFRIKNIPQCGNTIKQGSEICDDGNLNNNDSCQNDCTAPPPMCGNGRWEPPGVDQDQQTVDDNEHCDDGNMLSGDGCSNVCKWEEGYRCTNSFTAPSTCVHLCGNGYLNLNGVDNVRGTSDDEQCDDGNLTDGDGCSRMCKAEEGYRCEISSNIHACTRICGNSVIESNGADDVPGNADDEQCDDGNVIDGDGCSSACHIDDGFECDTSHVPTDCRRLCGDRHLDNGEQCDDGNTASGDGCNSACTVEEGYECDTAEPMHCSLPCGNGRLEDGEQCDDKNTGTFDGCSDTCMVEEGWQCHGVHSICSQVAGSTLIDAACTDIRLERVRADQAEFPLQDRTTLLITLRNNHGYSIDVAGQLFLEIEAPYPGGYAGYDNLVAPGNAIEPDHQVTLRMPPVMIGQDQTYSANVRCGIIPKRGSIDADFSDNTLQRFIHSKPILD